jgi:KaiC/GvpD/RAD55 family RecA-like ATPase
MTQRSRRAYEFPPHLPLSGVDPGTNLLVSGPSASGARELALRLAVPPAGSDEGLLLVSADVPGRALLDRCDELERPVDRGRLGIVDCAGTVVDEHRRFSTHGDPIDDPGQLDRVGVELSTLYESIVEGGVDRVRLGVFSLSSMVSSAPHREVSRFVHMLSGRVIATDDLGVYLVDSTTTDSRLVDSVAGFCDGRIEVRSPGVGDFEVRVEGLEDQPTSWTALDLPAE